MADWLYQLSKDAIEKGPFPLTDLLKDALYYPASGFDGDPVRHFSNIFESFFYVDYSGTEQHLNYELRTRGFNGFRLLGSRKVYPSDLSPTPWQAPDIPFETDMDVHYSPDKAFCRWMVFEEVDSELPKRFSLLYLYADGVATYLATYNKLGLKPKGVAIIQSGHQYGNNWAVFPSTEGLLYKSMKNNSAGMPEYLVYGGYAPIWRSEKEFDREWFFGAHLDLEEGAKYFEFDTSCWSEYLNRLGYFAKYDERARRIDRERDVMGVLGLWKK